MVDLSTAETPLIYQETTTQHSLLCERSTKTYFIRNKKVIHAETASGDHTLATSRVLAQWMPCKIQNTKHSKQLMGTVT